MKKKSVIKFTNGSEITTVKTGGNVRSKRGEESIEHMVNYIKTYPEYYRELVDSSIGLKWYQKLMFRLYRK